MGVQSERLEKKLLALVENAAKALILEINKELQTRGSGTPVDTGHARASWIPSVGAPHAVQIVGADKGPQQAGVAQVMSFRLGQGMLYLTNAAPYIRRLNDGWSDQAPALFVEACIDRAMSKVKAKTGVDFGQTAFRASTGGGAGNVASAYSPFGDD